MLKSKDRRLTDAERTAYLAELRSRLSRRQSNNKGEAIAALESAAHLLDDDDGMRFPAKLREALLPVVEAATGLTISDAGPVETATVAGGTPAHVVPLVLGVTLNLSQEFRLLSVTLSPDDWREWKRWMIVVGMAGDVETATDVAENHDHYLAEPTRHATDTSRR